MLNLLDCNFKIKNCGIEFVSKQIKVISSILIKVINDKKKSRKEHDKKNREKDTKQNKS